MKLLLTSSGITNDSIAKAFEQLVGKPFTEIAIAFIPIAANVAGSSKIWLINDLSNILKYKPKALDIVDFSAVPQADWLPRLERVDVLFFGGGNAFHLIFCIDTFELRPFLDKWLKTKVYAGISAGSAIAAKDFALNNKQKKEYAESIGEHAGENALGLVDFYIRPHFNNPKFPHASEDSILKTAKTVHEPIYAIDDNSAVVVNEKEVRVVSEGEWKKFN